MKRCSRCKTEKPLEAFNRDRSRKDGLQHRCRECRAVYRQDNREAWREYQNRYNQSGVCDGCGGVCDRRYSVCKDCSNGGPGGYNLTTIGRRDDRWDHTVLVYLRTVEAGGKTWVKVGIGTEARANSCAGEVLRSLEMPLALAFKLEQETLEYCGRFTAPEDGWPNGLGGRTECIADSELAWLTFNWWGDHLQEVLADPGLLLGLEEDYLEAGRRFS